VRVRVLLSMLCLSLVARPSAMDRGAGGAASPIDTRFESRGPGEVIVPVTVGGRGPFRFLLDTGSTHTAVTEALASALGARPVARTSMSAAGGTLECLVVALARVAIGGVGVDGLTATALPRASAAVLGDGLDGVLGQDFLARFSYTIDYRASRIRWHEPGYVAPGVRLALVPSHDRWLVELPQQRGVTEGRTRTSAAPVYRFVPDSGADTLVLYGDGVAERVVREWRFERAALGSVTGPREVRTGIVGDLRVGDATLERELAVVVPGERREPDGLLPLHLFASVQLNASDRYLVIQPR
jgi:predicted aspartyl protease